MSPDKDNADHAGTDAQSDGEDQHCPTLTGPEFRPVETLYLKQLKATHRACARAALRWRPRFLKALAMSCSFTFALKAARVCYNTVRAHEQNDPEFAAQVREAEQEGADLLHHVCWKAAVEGNVEPVYWQGEIVGWVRKFDTRLQIEFLRAHMPDTFKAPGSKINVNTGNQPAWTQMDPKELDELVALRQAALKEMFVALPAEKQPPVTLVNSASAEDAPDGAATVGMVPALPVPPSA